MNVDVSKIIEDQIKPRRCHECDTRVVPIEIEVKEPVKGEKNQRSVYVRACPRCHHRSNGQEVSRLR